MKRKGKHCSDCGAELKRIHREGYPPYKCCVSKICKDNHVVKMAPTGIPPAYPGLVKP